MLLSIIIPVYNEEKTIAKLIKNVVNVKINKEIIICNDGSTDDTEQILSTLKIRGEIVVIQDADLETKPEIYPNIIKPILDRKADVVFTYRIRSFSTLKVFIYKIYFIGTILQTSLANLLFNTHIHDINSGCKMLRTDLFRQLNLKSNSFDIDQEIAAKVLRKHCKIKEFPIMYFPRTSPDGKKIRLLDGIKGLFAIVRYRFTN